MNLYQGMFYFDQSFRPVPLEQHFLGAKGKPNSSQSRENIDIACFDKVRLTGTLTYRLSDAGLLSVPNLAGF